jgi:hypothetical protein
LTHGSRPDYINQELGTTKAQKAYKVKKDDCPRTRITRQKFLDWAALLSGSMQKLAQKRFFVLNFGLFVEEISRFDKTVCQKSGLADFEGKFYPFFPSLKF